MSIAVASDTVTRVRRDTDYYRRRQLEAYRTYYFGRDEIHPGPQGFLLEVPTPHGVITPHFHRVDQFQVFIAGGGRIGKHRIDPVTIHYSDGYTPYGPIVAGADGITFFNLRSNGDFGQHEMPGSRDEMIRGAGRAVTVRAPVGAPSERATIATLLEPAEDGLAVYVMRVAAGESVAAPDPGGGGGQFHVVLAGILDGGTRLPARSAVWVGRDDPAATYQGLDGDASVLVAQFPYRPAGWRPVSPPETGGDP